MSHSSHMLNIQIDSKALKSSVQQHQIANHMKRSFLFLNCLTSDDGAVRPYCTNWMEILVPVGQTKLSTVPSQAAC